MCVCDAREQKLQTISRSQPLTMPSWLAVTLFAVDKIDASFYHFSIYCHRLKTKTGCNSSESLYVARVSCIRSFVERICLERKWVIIQVCWSPTDTFLFGYCGTTCDYCTYWNSDRTNENEIDIIPHNWLQWNRVCTMLTHTHTYAAAQKIMQVKVFAVRNKYFAVED